MFYIGLYREQHEKIFLSETTKSRALIFGASINKYTSTKFVQIIALEQKMAPPRGSQVLHKLLY